MKLHNLRDFVAVARSGGIRAAARELNLSQPALSKSIAQLEEELGTPLFDRSAQGSALNGFGRRFLTRAEAVMQELARGSEEIAQMRGHLGGHVAFAASSVVALSFLADALSRFRRRFPDARVDVLEGTHAVMLRGLQERRLDFAVGPVSTAQLPDGLVVERLFTNTRCVVGRRGHPLMQVGGLAGLARAEWLTTGALGSRDDDFQIVFERYGLEPPRSLTRCESLIALTALLCETDALAILPRQWTESPVLDAILVEVPVWERIDGPATCLTRPSGLPLTPAAEALADAIRVSAAHRDSHGLSSRRKSSLPAIDGAVYSDLPAG